MSKANSASGCREYEVQKAMRQTKVGKFREKIAFTRYITRILQVSPIMPTFWTATQSPALMAIHHFNLDELFFCRSHRSFPVFRRRSDHSGQPSCRK